MNQLDRHLALSGVCVACKQLKRKCDKALPECSTCVRVGRSCRYDSTPQEMRREPPPPPAAPASFSGGSGLTSRRSMSDRPSPSFGSAVFSIDPFSHEALRKPTVDVAVCGDAIKVLGTRDEVMVMTGNFFETLCKRMPFISRARFYRRLPSMYTTPQADFSLLCLSIHLAVQYPPRSGENVQSSVYIMIKAHVSLLEASGFLSLEFVQARLLLSVFEMGHGLYPAASISIGACARTARALGLNKKRFETLVVDDLARQQAEEEKRVWWEVVNLDRFINLCTGDALFATEDPSPKDLLPIYDDEWAQDTVLRDNHPTMATSADIRVGPFARECQNSHLLGRVLRHVFEPTPDPTFHKQEFEQLEITLMAFLPLLIQEQTTYTNYCAALGMCSCALFTLYDSELLFNRHNEAATGRVLSSMESTATRISQFSRFLFTPIENVNIDMMSPFVPYSLYQAAAVLLRMWRLTKSRVHEEGFESLKTILGHFNIRWRAAGIYLDALANLDVTFPITMHFMQGVPVSARGPPRDASAHFPS